jgi:ABC-type amino acid transport substrate-binding protein
VGHQNLSRLALRRLSALGLIALAAAAGAPAHARPLEAVRLTGTLRVTVYTNNKPFSWDDNGKPAGIDVEIGAALAKAIGVKPDFFSLRPDDNINDDLRNGVWKGTVFGATPGDVMLHVPYDKAIEAANDRIALAAPYHEDALAMAIDPAKAEAAMDFSLFETEKVAVDVGTLADMILVSARDHKLIANVVHFRGTERAAGAFERGEVSAFYGDGAAIEAFAGKGSRPFKIIYPDSKVARGWRIGIAVKADSRDLAEALAKEMASLQASGDMKRIFEKHGVVWREPKAD